MKLLLIFSLIIAVTFGRKGFGYTDQEWGYITVRKGAHMFWWLHKTTAKVDDYTKRPLIIWLQGGPGTSSSGYGNFAEIGPLDVDFKPRVTTWVKDVNVLFLDNPVGTGFSYVNDTSQLVTNNREIAVDFLVFLKEFYETFPELINTPLYIFGESYGGKMAAEIALVLDQAIKDGELNITLSGIALGDSWISPIDSVLTWGPYLLNLGMVDQNGYEAIQNIANLTRDAVNEHRWENATVLWQTTEETIIQVTESVDFYNILEKQQIEEPVKNSQWKRLVNKWLKFLLRPSALDDVDDKIELFMNSKVKDALGLPFSNFENQKDLVFNTLKGDFMKPVTDIVEELLNTTDIQVFVYNGQLDLIVDTPGTMAWVDALKFPQASQWPTAARTPLVVNGIIEGYVKRAGNLAMYWVNRAGHMVPEDNPSAMWKILNDITKNFGQ